jgi:hypothetical protein
VNKDQVKGVAKDIAGKNSGEAREPWEVKGKTGGLGKQVSGKLKRNRKTQYFSYPSCKTPDT